MAEAESQQKERGTKKRGEILLPGTPPRNGELLLRAEVQLQRRLVSRHDGTKRDSRHAQAPAHRSDVRSPQSIHT